MAAQNQSYTLPASPGTVFDPSSPPPPPPHQSPQQYASYDQYNNNGRYQPSQTTIPPVAIPQPAPAAQPPQRPQPKSRQKSRTHSFQSHKSSGSGGKIDLLETHAEKEAKRLHSKADPTMALSEAEPATVAAGEKSSLASLRNIQHRDAFGNPIAEPDRSNPTRSRWERPLDTIRSFEAAIDGSYNRKSIFRGDTDSVANWGRRASQYSNNGARFPHDSYYGSRPQSFRPDASMAQYDQQAYNGQFGGRQRTSRMNSEPLNSYRPGEGNVYPLQSNQRSYETVASASGSGMSGEPAGYQTDPTSSDNSSIDRVQSPMTRRKPEPVNDYGIGFSQSQSYQPPAFTVGVKNPNPAVYQSSGGNGMPPPVPQKEGGGVMRKPPPNSNIDHVQDRPDMGEKRKSWFMRRFSKQA